MTRTKHQVGDFWRITVDEMRERLVDIGSHLVTLKVQPGTSAANFAEADPVPAVGSKK